MAIERDPNERNPTNEELRQRAARLDNEIQPDPELAEGPASGSRITLFAIAIIAILGVVFYGLNNSAIAPEGNTVATQSSPATTGSNPAPANPAQQDAQKTAPNTAPGQTTGSAKPGGAAQPGPANTNSDPKVGQTPATGGGAPSR
jgi:hypothetical protein